MCGILGMGAMEGAPRRALRAPPEPMTPALRHRGPDGQGVFTDAIAALGHRRLAIIDREGGAQPIANEAGSGWIAFNGEVYNHRALRERLIGLGHVFRTHSDTEAILHAYEQFGADCVPMLEGMFAFAIYDSRNRELFIARDRLGKKPLFYAELGGALHFASEIKALRASPAWDPTLDCSQLEGYLSLGYFLAPGTPYRSVRKLLPGHWLRLRNGRTEVRRYWDIEHFDDHPATGLALEREVEAMIRTAVNDRLESEVPLGAFLSGGIDSGLVVSFMADALDRVTTTSAGFEAAEHNALEAPRCTAERLATAHPVELAPSALETAIDAVVAGFDEPFA